jgi:hypothetical protein
LRAKEKREKKLSPVDQIRILKIIITCSKQRNSLKNQKKYEINPRFRADPCLGGYKRNCKTYVWREACFVPMYTANVKFFEDTRPDFSILEDSVVTPGEVVLGEEFAGGDEGPQQEDGPEGAKANGEEGVSDDTTQRKYWWRASRKRPILRTPRRSKKRQTRKTPRIRHRDSSPMK